MSLADAVQAVQIARFAGHADCLLTWNARHFQGKLTIPVSRLRSGSINKVVVSLEACARSERSLK